MRLLFLRRDTLACRLIRLATWSQWSHVAVVVGADVIEATAAHGVRVAPLYEVMSGATKHAFANVACGDVRAQLFLREQLGRPYDWTAVLGVFWHRDWQEDDSWFCSELVASAALRGGAVLVRKRQNRITPEDVWTSVAVVRDR